MGNYSKVLTVIPTAIGLILLITSIYFGFELEASHLQLIQWLAGGTIAGGVVNATAKRYTEMKEKHGDALERIIDDLLHRKTEGGDEESVSESLDLDAIVK